jgi:hypothetical protein
MRQLTSSSSCGVWISRSGSSGWRGLRRLRLPLLSVKNSDGRGGRPRRLDRDLVGDLHGAVGLGLDRDLQRQRAALLVLSDLRDELGERVGQLRVQHAAALLVKERRERLARRSRLRVRHGDLLPWLGS